MVDVYLTFKETAELADHFAFPPATSESLSSSMSLSTLSMVRVFTYSHCYRYVVVSYHGFNLHFPNKWQCQAALGVPKCHHVCPLVKCPNLLAIF